MLIIESMDDDTETRRLSPLALTGGSTGHGDYTDLINGPMDHGWCALHFKVFFTNKLQRNSGRSIANVNNRSPCFMSQAPHSYVKIMVHLIQPYYFILCMLEDCCLIM